MWTLIPALRQKLQHRIPHRGRSEKGAGLWCRSKGKWDAVETLLRKKYVDTLVLILCTMLMGMFAVVYLGVSFTKPIDELWVGAQQVAQGNLYVSLPEAGPDEIAGFPEPSIRWWNACGRTANFRSG